MVVSCVVCIFSDRLCLLSESFGDIPFWCMPSLSSLFPYMRRCFGGAAYWLKVIIILASLFSLCVYLSLLFPSLALKLYRYLKINCLLCPQPCFVVLASAARARFRSRRPCCSTVRVTAPMPVPLDTPITNLAMAVGPVAALVLIDAQCCWGVAPINGLASGASPDQTRSQQS